VETFVDLKASSDEHLVALLSRGDASALEALYDRYVRQCFGLALRILANQQLAEEVVQEVFLRVWADPSRFNSQKGHFASWLLSVVHHRCIDELRRRSYSEVTLETPDNGSLLDSEASDEPDPGEQVWIAETRKLVRKALADIPDNQRQIIELAYFGGLSQSEIAARLGQPLGTVKTRMRSGLQRLKTVLEPLNLRAE